MKKIEFTPFQFQITLFFYTIGIIMATIFSFEFFEMKVHTLIREKVVVEFERMINEGQIIFRLKEERDR